MRSMLRRCLLLPVTEFEILCQLLILLTLPGSVLSILYGIAVYWSSVGTCTPSINGYSLAIVLMSLSAFASVFNFVLLDPIDKLLKLNSRNRAWMRLPMLVMTLLQLGLVVAFACCSVLCCVSAYYFPDSFKVSG